ncbi:hypothetical protein [Mesorhizobium amorphae]|uniref:hypothetical protein n=1 Tax=Mesorhizobium amorphae TaxID=71433 RepID=UPI00177BF411|nr:hypothetical protein [Mesorhizobium amorphae]
MARKQSINVFGKADHNVTIYLLLGQLIIHWANNESLFLRILHGLVGTTMKDASTLFHSHKNTMGRLDLILALGNGKIADAPLKVELASLVSKFKGLSRTRNFFAHAMFNYDEELRIVDASGVTFDNKNQVFTNELRRFTPATINEINDANTKAVELNRDLWKFAMKLDTHFGREPEMPQQVPSQLLDELREPQSPPSTQIGE